MKANILMINPPLVMTDQGTFKLNEIQGHARPGAVIDMDTMKIVSNIQEECSV